MDNERISNQRLPIPVGAKYAQRQRVRAFRLRSLRPPGFNRWWLAAGLGLMAAGVGAAISTQPLTIAVSLQPQACQPSACTSFQIQGFSLDHTGTDVQGDAVYQSGYGVMLVSQTAAETRTSGSTTLNGADMTGACSWPSGSARASCNFRIGSRQLTATDTRTSSGWERHYSDGKEVRIDFPGASFPVPFAFGE